MALKRFSRAVRVCLGGRVFPGAPLALALLGLILVSSGSGPAFAQSQDEIFVGPSRDACVADPSSEECICAVVQEYGWVPVNYDFTNRLRGQDRDWDGTSPEYDPFLGTWSGSRDDGSLGLGQGDPTDWTDDRTIKPWVGPVPEGEKLVDYSFDLVLRDTGLYDEQCSFAYLRENVGRGWRFSVALGALFLTASLSWIGFVYMQESAQLGSAGSGWAGSRALLTRVLLGILVLALAGVAWEMIADFTVPGIDSWTLRRDQFYLFER